MSDATPHDPDDARAADVYRSVVWHLREAGIPYLVGGTYAMEHHAGLVRDTKDLDLFIRRADWSRVRETLSAQDIQCDLVYSHWLGKAHSNGYFVDMIFAGGNGLVEVDDSWLVHGVPAVVLGVPVHLVAAEEMIWSKSFVMERERFDGADITHILRHAAHRIEWSRLIGLFGANTSVLLAHLIVFQFAYPGHHASIPDPVMNELWRLARADPGLPDKLCRGTLLSREQYLVDIRDWGYLDAREMPAGRMTAQQIRNWTSAIGTEK